MHTFHLNTTILLCCIAMVPLADLSAQKKVYGQPKNYTPPVDYYDNPANADAFLAKRVTAEKDKDNAWLVISDRDNNTVYEKPDYNSPKVGTLAFRDYVYVFNEEEDWVEVVDATVTELKVVNVRNKLGWMPKKKLLLWNSGLVDLKTRIHKKVLLLNRADDITNVIQLQDKSLVDVYNSPDAKESDRKLKIYEYYFVVKKEKVPGFPDRYLLSEESSVSPLSVEKIVGWVDERRCSKWDTRICLEPNFEAEAFEERRDNPKYRLVGFENEESSKMYADGAGTKDVFWKDDPVVVKRDKMAKTNAYRFNGLVIRFPMLSVVEGSSSFRSGIIGSIKTKKDGSGGFAFDSEIPEREYAEMKKYIDQVDRKTDNVNIFFMIEATDSTYAYKESILSAISTINSSDAVKGVVNLNYGALVYRGLAEEKVTIEGKVQNRLTDYVSLTPDLEKVTTFIRKQEFRNYKNRDDFTALFYSMSESLRNAGFRENELNIILMVGSYGDFRIDRDLKASAKKVNHRALVEDTNPIYDNLSKLDVHLYAVQLRNDGSRASGGFAKQGQTVILESAKYAYNKYYGSRTNAQTQELLGILKNDFKMTVVEPSMADILEGDDIPLVGGRYPGRLIKPATGRYLTASQLSNALKNCVKESIDFERMMKTIVSEIYLQGNSLNMAELEGEYQFDGGRFAPALADLLNKVMLDETISNKNLVNTLDEKYKLFTEVFIPQQIQGAKFPTVSYVMYMPESDLIQYHRTIQRALSDGWNSYDKKRESLFEVYKELVIQFSGETTLRSKRPEDFTKSEIVALMQGLYNSGLKLNVALDVRIGDIRDERKVTDAQVDEMLLRLKQVEKTLDGALRAGEAFDFCYQSESGNRYYWIPLMDAF